MNKPAGKYTLGEVAKITGKSSQTINRHKNKGKISHELIDGTAYYEASELMRVYGNNINFDAVTKNSANSNSISPETKTITVAASSQIQVLEEKIVAQQIEFKDTRIRLLGDQLKSKESEIENLRDTLKRSQEATLLLKDLSKREEGDKLQQVLKPIQDEISQLKAASEIDKAKSNDLAKASKVYAGMALISVVGAIIFALVQSGIIQIN